MSNAPLPQSFFKHIAAAYDLLDGEHSRPLAAIKSQPQRTRSAIRQARKELQSASLLLQELVAARIREAEASSGI